MWFMLGLLFHWSLPFSEQVTPKSAMALQVSVLLVASCAGQHQNGRGGPDMANEFEQDFQSVTYPFQAFPSSYVENALVEGADWTTDPRGVVTSVKNQGPHGYCGTFARVNTAEGQYAIHSGQPARNFSIEQLVDCVGWSKNQLPSLLGEEGSETPGLMAWEDYPYNISKYPDTNPPVPFNPCKFDQSKVVPDYATHITGTTSPGGQTEDQAAAFIHHNGPVSCGINADVFSYHDDDWFVTADACKRVSSRIDHAVSCVGFGVDPVKGPYWKIKNSWGAEWGDQGFIKVARGVLCAGLGAGFGPVPVHGDISGYYESAEEAIV